MTFREGEGKRKREGGWTLEHFGQRRRRRDRVPSFFPWYARGWVWRGERKKGRSQNAGHYHPQDGGWEKREMGVGDIVGWRKKEGLKKGWEEKGDFVFPALVPG